MSTEKKDPMKREIALYEDEWGGSPYVYDVTPYMEEHSEYVRVTKPAIVQFTPLTREEIVPVQVAKIEKQITKVQAKAGLKVTDLKRRKQELLALTTPKEGVIPQQ